MMGYTPLPVSASSSGSNLLGTTTINVGAGLDFETLEAAKAHIDSFDGITANALVTIKLSPSSTPYPTALVFNGGDYSRVIIEGPLSENGGYLDTAITFNSITGTSGDYTVLATVPESLADDIGIYKHIAFIDGEFSTTGLWAADKVDSTTISIHFTSAGTLPLPGSSIDLLTVVPTAYLTSNQGSTIISISNGCIAPWLKNLAFTSDDSTGPLFEVFSNSKLRVPFGSNIFCFAKYNSILNASNSEFFANFVCSGGGIDVTYSHIELHGTNAFNANLSGFYIYRGTDCNVRKINFTYSSGPISVEQSSSLYVYEGTFKSNSYYAADKNSKITFHNNVYIDGGETEKFSPALNTVGNGNSYIFGSSWPF